MASNRLYEAIKKEMGRKFVLVSMKAFEVDGENRTRYTVRYPKGKKFYHLIGYPNGDVRKC